MVKTLFLCVDRDNICMLRAEGANYVCMISIFNWYDWI